MHRISPQEIKQIYDDLQHHIGGVLTRFDINPAIPESYDKEASKSRMGQIINNLLYIQPTDFALLDYYAEYGINISKDNI